MKGLLLRMFNLHDGKACSFNLSPPMNGITVEHLPAEVLSNIFTFCIPDPLKDDTGGRTTLEILEDVCDTWKMITSSTPELWTIISVKFHAGTKKRDVEQAFSSTKLFLQRSGVLSLRISIIDRDRSPNLDCASLLRLIAEHSKRWRYVQFEMPMKSHRLINQSHIRKQLSSLEELSLTVSVSTPVYRILSLPHPYTVFKVAPKLRAVRIGRCFPLDGSMLPWEQLVEWTGDLDAEIFFHLLRVSTHLRSCSLPLVTHRPGFQYSGWNRVENDSVSQLTVELNSLSKEVLPYVSLPGLTDLTIKDGTWGTNEYPTFSSRLVGLLNGAHSLRYLRLRQWSSPVSINLVELASSAPQVVSLELEAPSGLTSQCLTSDLLVALTPVMSGTEVIFPKLEHLTCSGFIFFSDEALYKFIASRWGGLDEQTNTSRNLCLKSVRLEHSERAMDDIWSSWARRNPTVHMPPESMHGQGSMKELKEKGFDISILHSGRVVLWGS